MEKFKKEILTFLIGGIAIFAFGIFIGHQLEYDSIFSIQGFLFNAIGDATDSNATDSNATDANATDANATDSNATDSNATDANATDSNATNANATSGNAYYPNNIIYLDSFKIKTQSAKAGEKIYIDFSTSGAYLGDMILVLKNKTSNLTDSLQVKSIWSNPYIVLPTNLITSSYEVTDVLLVGTNDDDSTFTKQYSNVSKNNATYFGTFGTINVTALETQKALSVTDLKVNSSTVKAGEKVYITFKASDTLKSLKLVFKTSSNQVLDVYVKSLTSKPYFEVPSTAKSGKYTLTDVVLISESSTKIYSNNVTSGAEKLTYKYDLEIPEVKEDDVKEIPTTYVYNIEDVNDNLISSIYKLPDSSEININAISSTVINGDLFDSIKGTNKVLKINNNDNQIIFNGKDIVTSKTIDVNIEIHSVEENEEIYNLVKDGIVVDFPNNGNLPGKAQVRIKPSTELNQGLNSSGINVYYYNTEEDKFTAIAYNISKSKDGYYEFVIDHNSSYILVNKKLDESLLTAEKEEKVVTFQKSNNVNLLLILGGLLVVIVSIVIVVVIKNKEVIFNKNKENKEK